MKVGIIGLGYVGLPLCLQFAKSGANVVGFDLDSNKSEAINCGESYINHISDESVRIQLDCGRLEATTEFARVQELEAVLICVPTPLDKKGEPDLSFVLNTAQSIAPHLPEGITVVLESTTYPGTTEEELRPILESGSGMKAGEGFYLAYSPEREDPGNPDSQVAKIPKVIGGCTERCLEKAKAVYSIAIETLVPVSSCRAAEATKLLENIFRCVNIALVNELKIIYQKLGIDIWEVISAAKTKPFGYMPFYPGPGLGGHCIPIDPFYLSWKAKQQGIDARFIELAGKVNNSMPDYVISRCEELLKQHDKTIEGSRVLIFGLAYKPNVDDDRESPSYVLMDKLESLGVEVDYHDPHIPVIQPNREYKRFAGRESITPNSSYDLFLLVTDHKEFTAKQIKSFGVPVVDSRHLGNGTENNWVYA